MADTDIPRFVAGMFSLGFKARSRMKDLKYRSAEASGPGVLGVTSSTLHLILLPAAEVVGPMRFLRLFSTPPPPGFA